jgi:hypothetical protein
MADRKYYCFCDSNCKYETLNREQILTAITQAVQTGKVGDCDTGFITSVKTINGFPLRFFVGTQSEYESLGETQKRNLFAIITNDTSKEALFNAIKSIREEFETFSKGIAEGRIVVPKATSAGGATKDGNGNTIADTYGNFTNAVTVQTSGSYTLPSEGYYHISFYDALFGYVDFGIIEYNGNATRKSETVTYIQGSGAHVLYFTLGINSSGAVTISSCDGDSIDSVNVSIRVRKIL